MLMQTDDFAWDLMLVRELRDGADRLAATGSGNARLNECVVALRLIADLVDRSDRVLDCGQRAALLSFVRAGMEGQLQAIEQALGQGAHRTEPPVR